MLLLFVLLYVIGSGRNVVAVCAIVRFGSGRDFAAVGAVVCYWKWS